jgi:hypothetical protein
MNSYNGFNLRDSITAAIGSLTAVTISVLFAATCLIGAVGPATAATPALAQTSIMVPLA